MGVIVFFVVYIRMCTNESDQLGNNYFDRGDFKNALVHYNEYLNLHPHDINTLYNRGRCLEELGFPGKASEDFEQVLERDPNNVKALLSLSQFYYDQQKYDLTINLCTSASKLENDNYLAHYFLARANHKIGDALAALRAYNATISHNPDFGFAYFQRGSLMISLGWPAFGCSDLRAAEFYNVKGAKEALQKYCR